MLDWLRRKPAAAPMVEVAGRALPIAIRRLAHARRLTLRLAPDGSEARLSIPRWVPEAEAIAFARTRAPWLAEQMSRVAAPVAIEEGALIAYRGTPHRILHAVGGPRRVEAAAGSLRIGGPAEGIEARLKRWLHTEARRLFAEDLAHYAARAGVPLPPMALSNARARWGSCSSKGIVRLNWRLVMAPDAVRRSVVAHEVAHLLHFDHSPAFHAALARLFDGDVEAANRWLKRHGRGLHAPFG